MSNSKLSTRGRCGVDQLPGDYKPNSEQGIASDETIGATLARVYALILSWQAPEPKKEQQGTETT